MAKNPNCMLPINFGQGIQHVVEFHVVECLRMPVILGMQWLKLGVMPTADPMGSQPWGRKSDPMGVKTPWGFSRGVPQKKNY